MKKGFLDISFSWVFALMIGAIILFGAIYGVNKLTGIKNTENSAEIGTELVNLLAPLETGLETAKTITISLPVNSRLNHGCFLSGTFGKEKISIEEKVKNKWTSTEVEISFENLYLFFPDEFETKKIYAFSKSFELPFKIANVIFLVDAEKKYCFVSAPRDIKNELQNTGIDVFEFEACSKNSNRICFEQNPECNVTVDLSSKKVTRDGETSSFEGDALMYGAIFSDKENYECEVQRVLKRAHELSLIYEIKSYTLLKRGCDSPLKTEFGKIRNLLDSYGDSRDLERIAELAEEMNSINKNAECNLW